MANPEPANLLINLLINGQRRELRVPPWLTLLGLLHERLDLMGSKEGYDHDQCGACVVLHNGRRVNTCLTLAVMCDGDVLTTVEGLAEGDRLRPLQQTFIRHDTFQRGCCTPRQICSAPSLANGGRARSRAETREGMSGNLCHYGAHDNILDAMEDTLPLLGRDRQEG